MGMTVLVWRMSDRVKHKHDIVYYDGPVHVAGDMMTLLMKKDILSEDVTR